MRGRQPAVSAGRPPLPPAGGGTLCLSRPTRATGRCFWTSLWSRTPRFVLWVSPLYAGQLNEAFPQDGLLPAEAFVLRTAATPWQETLGALFRAGVQESYNHAPGWQAAVCGNTLQLLVQTARARAGEHALRPQAERQELLDALLVYIEKPPAGPHHTGRYGPAVPGQREQRQPAVPQADEGQLLPLCHPAPASLPPRCCCRTACPPSISAPGSALGIIPLSTAPSSASTASPPPNTAACRSRRLPPRELCKKRGVFLPMLSA